MLWITNRQKKTSVDKFTETQRRINLFAILFYVIMQFSYIE